MNANRLRVCKRGSRGGALAKCGPLISNVWRTDGTKGNQYKNFGILKLSPGRALKTLVGPGKTLTMPPVRSTAIF